MTTDSVLSTQYSVLSGIRVVELCTGAAGPTVAKALGEYGAEVFRVESRRHRGPLDEGEVVELAEVLGFHDPGIPVSWLGTLSGVSVTQQGVTCPGPLEEERPGAGVCARGDACEVLELRSDYLAYRGAHLRVTSAWRDPKARDSRDERDSGAQV